METSPIQSSPTTVDPCQVVESLIMGPLVSTLMGTTLKTILSVVPHGCLKWHA